MAIINLLGMCFRPPFSNFEFFKKIRIFFYVGAIFYV